MIEFKFNVSYLNKSWIYSTRSDTATLRTKLEIKSMVLCWLYIFVSKRIRFWVYILYLNQGIVDIKII